MVASKEVSVKRFGNTSVMAKKVKPVKEEQDEEFDFNDIKIFEDLDE